jgi:hypothetical protein
MHIHSNFFTSHLCLAHELKYMEFIVAYLKPFLVRLLHAALESVGLFKGFAHGANYHLGTGGCHVDAVPTGWS